MGSGATITRRRILCVDDDPSIRRVLQIILSSERHEVVTAPDGQAALDCITREKPDLLILDVTMPGIDGYEVMRRLADLGASNIPVILLTGSAEAEETLTGDEKGAVCYVSKPFVNNKVRNVVACLIGDLSEEERKEFEHLI
jgi:CheY-like chemotaxis protein